MVYRDENGVCWIEIKISSEECVFFLSFDMTGFFLYIPVITKRTHFLKRAYGIFFSLFTMLMILSDT